MKKSDLIALLAQYPDDIEVYMPGYESGWDPVCKVEVRRIVPSGNDHEFAGKFKDDEKGPESLAILNFD